MLGTLSYQDGQGVDKADKSKWSLEIRMVVKSWDCLALQQCRHNCND